MKTYFTDVIPKIQRFSKSLNETALLKNKHWIFIDNYSQTKTVYIFRNEGILLIAVNGRIEHGKWELLGNESIMIAKEGQFFLFKLGFFEKDFLALKLDSKNEYALFVDENKFDEEIDSSGKVFDLLKSRYLDSEGRLIDKTQNHVDLEFPNREDLPFDKENVEYMNYFIVAIVIFFLILIAWVLFFNS